jgi:hypothetical protein
MKAHVARSERSPPTSGLSSHGDVTVAESTVVGRADVR